MMTVRRSTVEHPFGTLKFWMGSAHFLMKTLRNVKTERAGYPDGVRPINLWECSDQRFIRYARRLISH
jgi:hypothetical protein